MTWTPLSAPPDALPPRPITMRAQSIPARHEFPEHAQTGIRWSTPSTAC